MAKRRALGLEIQRGASLRNLSFLCRRSRFAAPQRTQRPFVSRKSARITPFPSCWDDVEVMDDVPDSGLFMGSNVFLAAGDPVGMGRTRIPPIGRRSRTITRSPCRKLQCQRSALDGRPNKTQWGACRSDWRHSGERKPKTTILGARTPNLNCSPNRMFAW